jgi:hypothetical protein
VAAGFVRDKARLAAGRVAHALEVRKETDQNDDGKRNSEQEQENRAHIFSPLADLKFFALKLFLS